MRTLLAVAILLAWMFTGALIGHAYGFLGFGMWAILSIAVLQRLIGEE